MCQRCISVKDFGKFFEIKSHLIFIKIHFVGWVLTKSFVLASFVEEYGILLLRFVGTLMLTIIVGLGRCVWYASQVLVEASQAMTNV